MLVIVCWCIADESGVSCAYVGRAMLGLLQFEFVYTNHDCLQANAADQRCVPSVIVEQFVAAEFKWHHS